MQNSLGLRMRKLVNVVKYRNPRIDPPFHPSFNPVSTFFQLASYLRHRAQGLCFLKLESEWVRLGRSPTDIPKGKLAVYVGESDDKKQRVLVPVIHLNHPLFSKLLEEAEKVYGFNHAGGIFIPCGISEFEAVQTIIATTHYRWW